MGGSSKPADPKVTPYQEPAAPTNPIPNWFATGASGGSYTPNTGGSQSAFGQPAQPAAQPAQPQQTSQAMDTPSTPWQAPQGGAPAAQSYAAGQGMPQSWGGMNRPMTPFSIPTQPNMGGLNDRLMQSMASMAGMGGSFGNDMMQRFQSNPSFLMDMFGGFGGTRSAPRYQNYTDTNPAQSTDATGMTLGNPFRRS